MKLTFVEYDKWYEKLSQERQEKFSNDYEFIYTGLYDWIQVTKELCDNVGFNNLSININETAMKQAMIDAYDDLERLADYHGTKSPNPLKEMAYYVYWFIQRKPLTLLDDVAVFAHKEFLNIEKTHLMFCNEHFCVQLLINAAFPGLSDDCQCDTYQNIEKKQLNIFKEFLLYYLTYRLDSPKSLEAILLAVTMHPFWHTENVVWGSVKQEVEK